jgi:uncharacterized protein
MSELRPSEEILNAFVDGEFSPEDRLSALKSIAANDGLSREVCDMYQLKELVGMAYRSDTLPHSHGRRVSGARGNRVWLSATVATVGAMALGLVALLGLTGDRAGEPAMVGEIETAQEPAAGAVALAATDARQVLLHVTDVGLHDAEALFDDIEHMFETAWLNGQELEVQVVVHGTAMDLVRTDLAPFPNRIRHLVYTYPTLRVTACGQSRARLEQAERGPIELLPWVEEVESGVEEAARRQAEGWTYIRM